MEEYYLKITANIITLNEEKNIEEVIKSVKSVCDEVEGSPQPGDIVLYKIGKCVSHGAIVVEWPTIIHSYIHLGVILQDGTKGSLARRIAGFFRMKRLKE